MSNVRPTYIKRIAIELVTKYPEEFNGDFAHNRLKVIEYTDLATEVNEKQVIHYKKMLNRITGYATTFRKNYQS